MKVRSRFELFLLLSLALHSLAAVVWVAAHRFLPAQSAPVAQKSQPPAPQYTFMEIEKTRSRMVRTESGKITEKAAPDSYLGEKTRQVDRQTVSKTSSEAGGRSAAKAQPAIPLNQFALGFFKDLKSLKPTEAFESADQGNGTGHLGEYLKGVTEGDTTALNTKEYVFYGYFKRIRLRLERAWSGTLRERVGKMYRRGRKLATEAEHTTKTLVTMNGRGEVVKVQMIEGSGVLDLDDAAVMAFNEAGPFPNPPKGIVESDGTFKVRWDFVLRN